MTSPAQSPRRRPGRPASALASAPAAAIPTGPLRFSSTSDEPEEREPLFYIDDKEYSILSVPSASIGLTAIKILREERARLEALGLDPRVAFLTASGMAQDFTLREMLGDEGYEALLGYRRLKSGDLRRLIEVCSEKANAAMEEEGNPNL